MASSNRYVIRGAWVLSQDPAIGDLRSADILIEDGKIASVGADLGDLDAEVIDGTDRFALPGFVDSHRHCWQSLIRHMSTDWTLPQYFSGVRGVLGNNYSPEDMYAANLIAMLDALDSGITTLVDWSHNNNTPEHADAAIQAVLDSGIRCVWAYGNSNDEWLPVSDQPQSRDVARIAAQWFSSTDQLVTLALAPRGPQFATKDVTVHDFGLARELDIPVTVHVGDGAWGKSLPVLWLEEQGFADSRTTYVHCNMLRDDEFDVIARTGGAISIAPELEMHMGHGRLATLRARNRGIPVSLSIDLPVTATEVLSFATQGGATAAWLGDRVGSISVGKAADVILVRTDVYGMQPLNYPAGAIIESGNPNLVDTVFVGGQLVKRDGVILGHDFARVRKQAEDARDHVLTKAGVTDPGHWLPEVYAAPEG